MRARRARCFIALSPLSSSYRMATSKALVTTGDKAAGPQQLIRVWPVTVRGGVSDPTEGCILVHKTCHPCCALCNERVDNKGASPALLFAAARS